MHVSHVALICFMYYAHDYAWMRDVHAHAMQCKCKSEVTPRVLHTALQQHSTTVVSRTVDLIHGFTFHCSLASSELERTGKRMPFNLTCTLIFFWNNSTSTWKVKALKLKKAGLYLCHGERKDDRRIGSTTCASARDRVFFPFESNACYTYIWHVRKW
jgi:hypothetical protein